MTGVLKEAVVGHVPACWDIKPLSEVSDFITKGGTPTTYGFDWADESNGIPFFRSECVTDEGFNPKGMNFIPVEAHNQMSRSEVKPGDLLMTITGNVGRVAKASERFSTANINQHIARIRVLSDACADSDFVYQCLKHQAYATYYRAILTGQAYPQISLEQVRGTPVAFPPLPEQKKIAAILSAVDDKLDVITRQIEATRTLKQGLMQILFSRGVGIQDTNGRWLPHTEFKASELGEIPADWTVATVGEVCEVKGGKRLPKGETLTEENTGYPYIRVTDMFMGGVDPTGILYVPSHVQASIARYTISKDDIFISVAGTLGLVGIVPEELDGANLTENADKLTDIKINRDYLFYYLCSDAIQDLIAREATSNAQPKLALTRIREFSFPLPPDEEQARIATILVSVDGKLRLLSTKRESYVSLKRGLMQKLLTGEWRVKLDIPSGTA